MACIQQTKMANERIKDESMPEWKRDMRASGREAREQNAWDKLIARLDEKGAAEAHKNRRKRAIDEEQKSLISPWMTGALVATVLIGAFFYLHAVNAKPEPVAVSSVSSPGSSRSASVTNVLPTPETIGKRSQTASPKRPFELGEIYTVAMAAPGPRNLVDQREVINALLNDKQGLIEMMMQGRAAMVNAGETVRVIDTDYSIMHGIWVKVRVVNGTAKGTFWIPQEALGN